MGGEAGRAAESGTRRVAPIEPVPASPKLHRPHLRRAWLRRRRLIDMLNLAVQRPVTLVSAGPGWGKTVLVSAWAAVQRYPVAWLTLDRYDNDAEVFWTHVLAALHSAKAAPEGGPPHAIGALPGAGSERIRALRSMLRRVRTPAVLVLDDFHVVDDRQVMAELGSLLPFPRAALRIVVISRSEPAPALHRLRAAGGLSEIRASDLAFTAEEAAELLAGQGVHLPREDIILLLQRTEGWAVGLQLAAGFLAGQDGRSVADFAGDVRPVDEYLFAEVLARQPPQLRRFLLYTSICEHVCGDLADAITLETTGQRTLEGLENINQFVVRLGPRPIWFRFHHLIREALRHRLMLEDPDALPQLHQRAALWYARHGLIIDALEHTIAAQDWPGVGRLVVDAAPMSLTRQRSRLVKVLEQVPAETFAGTAELMVCAAIMLFNLGDYEGIPGRIDEAQSLLAARADTDRRPAETVIRALRAAVNRVAGDMPSVIEDTTDQLATLARAPLARLPSTLQYRAVALNNKGVGLLWTGRTADAGRYLWIAASAARAADLDLVEINAHGHLALLEVMSGSVREAERLVRLARDLAERRGWLNAPQAVAAHLAACLVELERDHPGPAERALQQGLRANRSDPEAAQWKLSLGIQARLAMTQDNLPNARAFLDEAHSKRYPDARLPALDRWLLAAESEADLLSDRADLVQQRYGTPEQRGELSLPERNLLARAALAARDASGAHAALLTVHGSVMSETVATVEARILTALLADSTGQGLQATQALGRAIALAAREGIRRPFRILAGGRLDALIARQRLTAGEHAAFVADLQALTSVAVKGGDSPPRAVALSDRETEVLGYLPTMLTAAEIGEELGVSVNTVKAHMRAIYRKLGAPRRRQAVVRAREHGFL